MHRLLVVLLLLQASWSITAQADVAAPVVLAGDAWADSVEAGNAAIAAQATAAVAAGQPTIFLVSFRTPEEAVTSKAQAISTAAGLDRITTQTEHKARRQVFADVKAKVLGPAANTAAVTTKAGPAQPPAPSIQIIKDRRNLPITTVSISSAEQLAQLRAHPDVLSVMPDGYLTVASTAAWEQIGQPAVAARGFLGNGTVVVIDTGLDYTKQVFGPCTAPGVPAATCKVAHVEDMVTDDGQLDFDKSAPGHGTNVAGVVASVAPGAKLIGLDIFDNGIAKFGPIADAVDWCVDNKDKYNITIINMSLGGLKATAACDDNAIAVALNSAYDFGIMTTAAAGNDADKTSVMIPACASRAVAVGAVYSTTAARVAFGKCTDTDVVPDKVTCFSNSSPKVDLLAPGHDIETPGTVKLSGTSQASPVVAGAIAVVRGRYPSYSLPQVLELLKSTGTPVKDPVNGLVIPRLNLRAAMGINCVPKLSPPSIRAANTGGSYTLTVTPPTADCKWTVATPSESWMRITGAASGTGPGTVTVQVDPASAAARAAGLLINGDSTAAILVSQAVVASTVEDARSPMMGRMKATAGAGLVDLTWPVAQDAESGVSTYKVVYNQGSRPPRPRCTTGTAVNQQPQASGSEMKMRVGLAAKTMYTFRVCALDAAGNVAFGTIWRGSTQ